MHTLIEGLMPWVRLMLAVLLTLIVFAMLRELEDREAGERKPQHLLRGGLVFALTFAACPWNTLLVPFCLILLLVGYLVVDPSTEDKEPMPPAPTRWRRFWQLLTGRTEKLAVWSAYLETFILLLVVALFAYLLYHG